jgi:hypothetical protein
MALAANGVAVTADKIQLAAQAINAAQLYNQSYSYMGSVLHATAANQGRVAPWSQAVGQIPIGISTSNVLGNTTLTPIPEGTFDMDGRIFKNIAVTGLAGTVADNGQRVYATADNAFTLVRPASPAIPCGFVTRFVSSTNANVFFFSTEVLMALMLAGGDTRTVCLGSICPVVGTGYLIGDATHGITWSYGAGYIRSVYAINIRACTDADVSLNVTLQINNVAVTGGVVNLLFSDAVGAVKAGTAVTATNALHEGNLIQALSAQVAAPTATDVGTYNLYITFASEFGL